MSKKPKFTKAELLALYDLCADVSRSRGLVDEEAYAFKKLVRWDSGKN